MSEVPRRLTRLREIINALDAAPATKLSVSIPKVDGIVLRSQGVELTIARQPETARSSTPSMPTLPPSA